MGMAMATWDGDCYNWDMLCYKFNLCRARVLEEVRRDWHKLSVLNVVVIVFLVYIYSIGYCAFPNTRLPISSYPYGKNYMSKVHPC
ncbi:Tetraspanin-5 [Acorus gramineus]|uniref:Tetraspanin-5 n=1 Tax=Acorus gramineus TaxID=55184 RepID=A0AAV9B5E9_ACOGR|nr:Tetraspanin-5 [Acorus gramineus]